MTSPGLPAPAVERQPVPVPEFCLDSLAGSGYEERLDSVLHSVRPSVEAAMPLQARGEQQNALIGRADRWGGVCVCGGHPRRV
jgi:hypothetical protein